jgi:phosphoribosylformimino-5-aminoimidazole carboxamide ribotide isomerase
MIIYPAIDLRGGRVVRLKEGDPSRQTVFSEDPVATAEKWIDGGASWLHIVNLDGAFAAANDNSSILERVASLGIPVQFGGGMRSLDDVAGAFERGATRVILGTIAAEQPEMVTAAIERWGSEAICIGLDARGGKVTTRGWQTTTDQTPAEMGQAMAARGVRHALYTDVDRDGLLQGVNVAGTVALAEATGLQVIASGGVGSLQDIEQLSASGKVAGAIIGMALYAGRVTLPEAIAAAGGTNAR